MTLRATCPEGVEVLGSLTSPSHLTILTPAALTFLATLHRTFSDRRVALLALRRERQKQIDEGEFPGFLRETEAVRRDVTWKGPGLSPGLRDRRVEITGPVERKMVINGLNSGATQFMVDFEDATSPTWKNMLDGQVNVRDALARTITYDAPNGKHYTLHTDSPLATLLVRPRGWHLLEKHVLIDGQPISGSLFDFGLYFFHCAKLALDLGHGPYFYLPKLESHLEARLWNDIFNTAQDILSIPRGTIRATVLIETILAAFEMDEILFELREHSSGLNCGRWDYVFSVIKKFWKHKGLVLPERKLVTMETPFMEAYVRLVIQTCHKRGVHAMGGMAAQLPNKTDPVANTASLTKVRQDKLREARLGHDGTWVSHPDLIPIARSVFDQVMPGPHQIHVRRDGETITALDLLNTRIVSGEGDTGEMLRVTEEGVRENVSVCLVYMENWLKGVGCVPFKYCMEDAATAEIARSQLWQWIHHQTPLTPSSPSPSPTSSSSIPHAPTIITTSLIRRLIDSEASSLPASPYLERAKHHLINMVITKQDSFVEFLTSECYDDILEELALTRAKAAVGSRL